MDEEKIKKKTFEDFNLNFELLRGLYSLKFEEPTVIQEKLLSEKSSTKDILISSPSQTGKRISFIIYSLQRISQLKKDNTQVLILCHTREAVSKIRNIFLDIAKYMNIKIHCLLGGTIKDDIKELSNGIQIVMGTPGRVLDIINKKILLLNELSLLIIDDITQMIERDFLEIISNIINLINSKCNKIIIEKVDENEGKKKLNEDIKKKFNLKDDNLIEINNLNDNKNRLINYKIFQISLKEEWKFNILINLYKLMEISQSIIYCNDSKSVEELNKNLIDKKFRCNSLNDDRNKVINMFKKGQIRVLITSDIKAEEINLYNNSIIIYYDIPNDINIFLKYVGRNEFFGKEGLIINFITEKNKDFVESLEKIIGYKIQELPIELSNV